jgi:hypothetical protein
VSAPLYHHALHIASVLEHNRPEVILEIGGGYGGPCFQWFKNKIFRPKTYVIVDIPESLFYSEIFLKIHLKSIRIKFLKPNEEIIVTSAPVVYLCTPEYLEKIKNIKFNLIFNTGSLGEMSVEWAEIYLKFINESKSDYYLTHNRFNEPINFESEIVNTLIPFPNSNWQPIAKYIFEGEDPEKVRSTALVIFKKNIMGQEIKIKSCSEQKSNPLLASKMRFLEDILFTASKNSTEYFEKFLEKFKNSHFSKTNEYNDIQLKLQKKKVLKENYDIRGNYLFSNKNLIGKLAFIKYTWLSGNPEKAKQLYNYYDIKKFISADSLISMIYLGGLSAELGDKVMAEKYYELILKNEFFNDPIGKILHDLLITMLSPNFNDDLNKILSLFKANIEFMDINKYL